MTHICVSILSHHWFRWWLVAPSVPSHYMNQCLLIVNRPLEIYLSEIWIAFQTLFFTKMQLKISSGKWQPFCLWSQCVNIHLYLVFCFLYDLLNYQSIHSWKYCLKNEVHLKNHPKGAPQRHLFRISLCTCYCRQFSGTTQCSYADESMSFVITPGNS